MDGGDQDLWNCTSDGNISLSLRGVDARRCMSWSTEGSCEFRQRDLESIRADLVSEGCQGLWVAPLWMAPEHWKAPQHATGEVDVFERGCVQDSGYVASFGEAPPWVIENAWYEQGHPDVPTNFTAYMTFDAPQDRVTMYKCPLGSSPEDNPEDFSRCALTSSHSNYFHDTRRETHDGYEYMRLVSNLWNECERLSCGRKPPLKESRCEFQVSRIRLKFRADAFTNGKSPFKRQDAQVCRALTEA
jgi:hypothetical protein